MMKKPVTTKAPAEQVVKDIRRATRKLHSSEEKIRIVLSGLTPDWMPGVVPRCVPVEVKHNQHGERATTIVVGTERVLTRGKWRTVEVLACPVTYSPHPQQIEAARRGYEDWRAALGWVGDGLRVGGLLREVEVTNIVPRRQPWVRR